MFYYLQYNYDRELYNHDFLIRIKLKAMANII